MSEAEQAIRDDEDLFERWIFDRSEMTLAEFREYYAGLSQRMQIDYSAMMNAIGLRTGVHDMQMGLNQAAQPQYQGRLIAGAFSTVFSPGLRGIIGEVL